MTDPLAELRGIHEPTAVPWWPPGPGWWLVMVALALVAALAWRWRRQRPLLAWLRARQALRELELLRTAYLDSHAAADYLRGINAVLRRLALCRHPRSQVAPLSDAKWLTFLDHQAPADAHFSQGCGAALGLPSYESDPQLSDAEQLHRLACAWARWQGNPLSALTRDRRS